MKKKWCCALVAVLLLCLTACGPQGVPVQMELDGSLTHYEEYAGQDGELILQMDFSLPRVRWEGSSEAAEAINAFYEGVLEEWVVYAKDWLPMAQEQAESEFPQIYYFGSDWQQTRSDERLFSIYREEREHTGGAHDMVVVWGDTFDVPTGRRLSLEDLFTVPREEYRERLMAEIHRQMEGQLEFYYPDADDPLQLAEELFSEEQFFLTETGLVLFYQIYDLAPYAHGVPRFEIPYESLEDIWAYGEAAEEK